MAPSEEAILGIGAGLTATSIVSIDIHPTPSIAARKYCPEAVGIIDRVDPVNGPVHAYDANPAIPLIDVPVPSQIVIELPSTMDTSVIH